MSVPDESKTDKVHLKTTGGVASSRARHAPLAIGLAAMTSAMISTRPLVSVAISAAIGLILAPTLLNAQGTPASALLELAGWHALKAGQIQQAADAFSRAIAEDPQSATALFGAGLAAHLLGQPAEARQVLDDKIAWCDEVTR